MWYEAYDMNLIFFYGFIDISDLDLGYKPPNKPTRRFR